VTKKYRNKEYIKEIRNKIREHKTLQMGDWWYWWYAGDVAFLLEELDKRNEQIKTLHDYVNNMMVEVLKNDEVSPIRATLDLDYVKERKLLEAALKLEDEKRGLRSAIRGTQKDITINNREIEERSMRVNNHRRHLAKLRKELKELEG